MEPFEKYKPIQLQFDWMDETLDSLIDELEDLLDPEDGDGDGDTEQGGHADKGDSSCDEATSE